MAIGCINERGHAARRVVGLRVRRRPAILLIQQKIAGLVAIDLENPLEHREFFSTKKQSTENNRKVRYLTELL